MPGKIPEARLSREAPVDEHVEAVDAKKCGITLPAREDIQSRMTESNIADDVGRFHQLIQRLGDEILSNVVRETSDCGNTRGENVIGIQSHPARSAKSV